MRLLSALLAAALLLVAALAGPAAAVQDPLGADPHLPKFEKTEPARDEEPAQPAPAGNEDCPGFRDVHRPDPRRRFLPLDGGETLDVDAPKGQFKLVVEPSGAEALAAIDAQRRQVFPRDFDAAQARMLRCTRAASQVILVTTDGQLLGVHKTTRRYAQPYEIWSYELNEKGRTKKVLFDGGKLDGMKGLCVRFIDQAGVEFYRTFIEALDVLDEKNDDGGKTFKSICGTPLGS